MTCKDCIHYEVCNALAESGQCPLLSSSQCGCFKDKSLVLELPFIAMVEQELTADCKFNRRSASKNGKIAVVYIDKSKSGLPLIDITNQFYNTDTAKERIKQLKELSNEQ